MFREHFLRYNQSYLKPHPLIRDEFLRLDAEMNAVLAERRREALGRYAYHACLAVLQANPVYMINPDLLKLVDEPVGTPLTPDE
jgi:hypothetical protein